MKSLKIALLLLTIASPAAALSGATCYPGGFELSYGVLSAPEIVGGALSWEHDANFFITTTLPCLVRYEPPGRCISAKTAPVMLYCYQDGEIVYDGGALNLVVDEGAMTWTEYGTGAKMAATIPCVTME